MIILLLILSGYSGYALAQKNISGNIRNIRGANKYPHTSVTAIPAANKITVSDPTGFFAGDTILLIQMQGVRIYTSPYGSYADKLGEPGNGEFIIISSISGNDFTFLNNLKVTYSILGNVQVVKVPSFSIATVTAKLDCDPWDPGTKSGGVLAMIVRNTLTLKSDIDVSGLGFRGGGADFGDGICQQTNASYQLDYYDASYTNAGYKGEGIANYNSSGTLLGSAFAKGKGPNFTGGGGGNGNYSGGGGGSNRGFGGTGGSERSTCSPIAFGGGVKGNFVEVNDLKRGMIFGGGGGASTKTNPTGITNPGGNGGGIVIIIANTIIGDGGHILAKGDKGGNGGGTGPAGAGGGGAGGTIALSVLGYSGSFHANVNGGNGGDNPSRSYGEGGGGSGGLIWLTIDNITNLVPDTLGGLAGSCSAPSAEDGEYGDKRSGFIPNMNGFLFNSVKSSVTDNQVDSTCSNMAQAKILGTSPVGGKTPYTYKWEASTDIGFTSPVVLTNDADPRNYTPKLVDNLVSNGFVYFRRTIDDSSVPTPFHDVSLPVKVKVQPFIKNNVVGPADTICMAQNPPAVGPMASLSDGNGTYSYKWMVSTVNGTSGFAAPSNNTNASYTPPPALTMDSWYRRTVYSGRCTDSSAVVKIKVLNNIGNNTITSAAVQEICNGGSFAAVTATVAPALTGGDGSYRYKWVSSATGWNPAPDTYTNASYNPVATSFPLSTTISLRRVVYSGIHDVCIDTTTLVTAVKLTRWPVIINNNILADQAIGYDSIPQILTENPAPGMSGGGGAGTYYYTWQKDTLSWANAPGPDNIHLTSYQPPALKVTTAFRRFVTSPTSAACSSISNVVTITVHEKITNTIALADVSKDTIATGTGPGQITGSVPTGGSGIPGDYSYKWYFSLTGISGPYNLIPGAVSKDYDPGVLTTGTAVAEFYFRRDVASPIAVPTGIQKSNIVKVVVLPPLISYNINGSIPKCYGFRPDWLKGSFAVNGGDGKYKYTWQDSSSLHNFTDIPGFVKCDSANYKPPVLFSGAAYRRIVYSGKNYTLMNATSNIVRVIINPLPTASIISLSDTSICGGTAARVMVALTGATKFKVTMKEDGTDLTEVQNIIGPNYNFSITKTPAATAEVHTYALSKVIDQNGCAAAGFPAQARKVTVYKQPVPDAGPDVPQVCGPNTVLSAKAAIGIGTWTWKKTNTASGPGNAWFNNSNDPGTKVQVDSLTAAWEIKNSYRFYWTDLNGICPGKDSVNITFDKRVPKPVFDPPGLTTSNPDRRAALPSVTLTVGTGVWEPATMVDNGNIAKNLADGNNIFTYVVTNDACSNSTDYLVKWQDIKIPKGFSPNNGDPTNDKYIIEGIDLDANIVTLKIINSAGSEVFFADNDNWRPWDGTRNGVDAPEGTYYYLLTLVSKWNSAVRQDEKGFLVLQRKTYR